MLNSLEFAAASASRRYNGILAAQNGHRVDSTNTNVARRVAFSRFETEMTFPSSEDKLGLGRPILPAVCSWRNSWTFVIPKSSTANKTAIFDIFSKRAI